MRRPKHRKKNSFIGLFLLAAFLNLYFIQLACDLPHLFERLMPSVLAHSHGTGHDNQSTDNHHVEKHTHKNTESPDPLTGFTDCCEGQDYAPFVKASPSVELPSLIKNASRLYW